MRGARRKAGGSRLRPLAAPRAIAPLTTLAVPAGPGVPPPDIVAQAFAVAETIRARVRERLLLASSAGSLERLLDAIETTGADCVAIFEDHLRRMVVANSGHRQEMAGIACRRGCAFCCHVTVDVTPLEAIRLVARERSAARRAAIAARAADGARHAPCPLLVDGACSQYDARPFACRSLFSPDAASCEAGFAGGATMPVPSLDWPRFLASGYITGEIAALDDLGLASHMVALKGALKLLVADDTAVARWLGGADVFPRRAE